MSNSGSDLPKEGSKGTSRSFLGALKVSVLKSGSRKRDAAGRRTPRSYLSDGASKDGQVLGDDAGVDREKDEERNRPSSASMGKSNQNLGAGFKALRSKHSPKVSGEFAVKFKSLQNELPAKALRIRDAIFAAIVSTEKTVHQMKKKAQIQEKSALEHLKFVEKISAVNRDESVDVGAIEKIHLEMENLMDNTIRSQLKLFNALISQVLDPLDDFYELSHRQFGEIDTKLAAVFYKFSMSCEKADLLTEEISKNLKEYNSRNPEIAKEILKTEDERKIYKYATSLTRQRSRLQKIISSYEELQQKMQEFWNDEIPQIISEMESFEKRRVLMMQKYAHKMANLFKRYYSDGIQKGINSLEKITSADLNSISETYLSSASLPNSSFQKSSPQAAQMHIPKSSELDKRSHEENLLYAYFDRHRHSKSSQKEIIARKDDMASLLHQFANSVVICVRAKCSMPPNILAQGGDSILKFKEGDIIRVTSFGDNNNGIISPSLLSLDESGTMKDYSKDTQEWWLGYVVNSQRGIERWFPREYVEILVNNHHLRLGHFLEFPVGIGLFQEFLKFEYCEENLFFWLISSQFMNENLDCSYEIIVGRLKKIFEVFIFDNAPKQINLQCSTHQDLLEKFEKVRAPFLGVNNDLEECRLDGLRILDQACKEIFELMESDCFVRFKKSDMFIDFLNAISRIEDRPARQSDKLLPRTRRSASSDFSVYMPA